MWASHVALAAVQYTSEGRRALNATEVSERNRRILNRERRLNAVYIDISNDVLLSRFMAVIDAMLSPDRTSWRACLQRDIPRKRTLRRAGAPSLQPPEAGVHRCLGSGARDVLQSQRDGNRSFLCA